MKDADADTYILLVTPIDENEEAIKMELRPPEQENTIRAEARMETVAPRNPSAVSEEDGARPLTPSSVKSSEGRGRPLDDIASGSRTRSSRIEDSVEALDQLEEELEAFDWAAHFHQMTSSDQEKLASRKSPRQTPSAPRSREGEVTTPQTKRKSVLKTGPATLRANSTTEPSRAPSIRKSVSLTSFKPDSSMAKGEEKPLAQAPLSNNTVTLPASLNRPKQPVKSTKPPTIPSFELPGAVTARRLKEQREARLAMQAAAEQAKKPAAQTSSIRRTKSVRASVVPNFELPGEAISRRKREQREAQLKAQEEEERKRREFKARPVRYGTTPGTYPRDTIASRARQQQKSATTENSRPRQASSSPGKGDLHPSARSPLSSTLNESQPRGRGPHAEPSAASHLNRAASHTSSTDSGKRSVLSAEDLEQQRLRGQVIFKRDNSFSEEKEREKQHREALAKLAREEAAERSRQQSREWAAKKLRKRMTIASLRDIAA
ncbi:hypothetical protein DL764_003131 [Monosporascus ibericus]|uniref:TPX2 C-terminal domain-containing protein n=1 Tax=Monosporascus ibericus TaxID=155417 RepID=A0A4Q4TLP7_9PEZI|nr:hypothetical protein DL764_003131 [Monosporascus ibericus]